ncbi:hypothetical protein D3C76_1516840 [compost metagenome]
MVDIGDQVSSVPGKIKRPGLAAFVVLQVGGIRGPFRSFPVLHDLDRGCVLDARKVRRFAFDFLDGDRASAQLLH